MCRLMFPLVRRSVILALIAFGAALASRADAGLIPVRVEQSPFEVDVLLEWTEEGTEEPLVVLDNPGDWVIRVNVIDNTATTGQWKIDILAFHSIDPHGGNRSGASGGLIATFDDALFGQVLDIDRFVFHLVIVPNEGDPSPPLPHLDRLQLDVYRDPISDAAHPSTIHLRIEHVTEIPEPSSISLLLIALISVGLVHRRIRGRVMVRKTKLSGFLFVLLALRIPPPRVGAFLWASVKPIPFSGSHVMKYVFVTMAAITLQLAIGLPHAAAETVEYSFTTIEFPGAEGTMVHGINNAGVIVGAYSLAEKNHGFVFDGATFTTIDFPNAAGTNAHDINDQGQIVGIFSREDEPLESQGFVFDGANYEVTSNFPGASSTNPLGINNAGRIVGGYSEMPDHDRGFTLDGASFTSVEYPGAGSTRVAGVNNLGSVVGTFSDAGIILMRSEGFVFDGVSFEVIDISDARFTVPLDINDQGVIVGWFVHDFDEPNGGAHGFVRGGDGSFMIDVPGSSTTFIRGINNSGDIVGTYIDLNGESQSFFGTPVPEPSSLCLLLSGCLAAVCPRRFLRRQVNRRDSRR